MDIKKNYYQILKIPQTATFEEIKKSYRTLAKKFHPDIQGNTESSNKMFSEIKEAYLVLSDKVKRTQYDAQRRVYQVSPYSPYQFAKDIKDFREEVKEKPNPNYEENNPPIIPPAKSWIKPLVLIIISLIIAYILINLPSK